MRNFLGIVTGLLISALIFEFLHQPLYERFDIQETEGAINTKIYYIRSMNMIDDWVHVESKWSLEEAIEYAAQYDTTGDQDIILLEKEDAETIRGN